MKSWFQRHDNANVQAVAASDWPLENGKTATRLQHFVRWDLRMKETDDFNPESREIFQQVISLDNAHNIAERIDAAMQQNRKEAGDYVRNLCLSKGYFNGRLDGHIRQSAHEIVCWVEVSCFGLPRQCCRADRLEAMDAALADAIRSPMGVVPDSVERYRSRWQRPRDV